MTHQHRLLMEAMQKARSRFDVYNFNRFKSMRAGRLTEAEIADLEHYLENT